MLYRMGLALVASCRSPIIPSYPTIMPLPGGSKSSSRLQEPRSRAQYEPDDPPPPYSPPDVTTQGVSGISRYPSGVQTFIPPSMSSHVAEDYPPPINRGPSSNAGQHHFGIPQAQFVSPDRTPQRGLPSSPGMTSTKAPSLSDFPDGLNESDSRRDSPSSPSSSTLHPNYLQSSYGSPSPSSSSLTTSSSLRTKNDGERGLSLTSFFGARGAPPSWSREPPPGLSYESFPAISLDSNTWELKKGFPELPPPCYFQPHPFATHDVTEDDWKWFLADIKKAASLSTQQRIASSVIPIPVGFVGGCYVVKSIEKWMLFRNRTAAGDLVDHWNRCFFNGRQLEAILSQAGDRLSGKEGRRADQKRMLTRRSSTSSCSSAAESAGNWSHHSEEGSVGGSLRLREGSQRDDIQRGKMRKKEDRKRQSREEKAKRKHGIPAPYQLVIQPL
ncbi:hypothetical protein BV22DRAFT_700782 [Leucogyrophana mollusca]|uniref:Uncharacterized protein n=1 Tax=Leucogyrophana mollusca TaxID=85980 RepID=A0ACB8BA90_9AGAM|nr:hypothetical protein BV22DRAFT_700782 [Leucogyrophana mollusca]